MNKEQPANYERLPSRNEMRMAVASTKIPAAKQLLDACFHQVNFDAPWTQTLYFAAGDSSTPKAHIRARRYVQASAGAHLQPNLDDEWWLEVKTQAGQKERVRMLLGAILVEASYPELQSLQDGFSQDIQSLQEFRRPILPVAATESCRTHYAGAGARVTLDEHMRYYGFLWGDIAGQLMGKKSTAKIEMKVEDSLCAEQMDVAFQAVGRQLDAVAIDDGSHEQEIRAMYGKFLQQQL